MPETTVGNIQPGRHSVKDSLWYSVRLRDAVLCLEECRVIYDRRHGACPKCGSRASMDVSSVLDPMRRRSA